MAVGNLYACNFIYVSLAISRVVRVRRKLPSRGDRSKCIHLCSHRIATSIRASSCTDSRQESVIRRAIRRDDNSVRFFSAPPLPPSVVPGRLIYLGTSVPHGADGSRRGTTPAVSSGVQGRADEPREKRATPVSGATRRAARPRVRNLSLSGARARTPGHVCVKLIGSEERRFCLLEYLIAPVTPGWNIERIAR